MEVKHSETQVWNDSKVSPEDACARWAQRMVKTSAGEGFMEESWNKFTFECY